ncbi:MAG: extracellular solute-binding protein [Pseudomonadales bacterium]|nr:extracellular solute-binding protein [Pseudomonadales bacterium]MBO6563125.1 extracellular solute-binding protein [Pseudomonadales bacterium]MBO6596927.1 extracellular solute-binding protein [Pseudomonadales bacterium]MBO6823084.1 extracellular solute-binding protein [Pseudomonadales bacterium]
MNRRQFLSSLVAASAVGALPRSALATNNISVEHLPPLEGELTLYLGRGEGGLYENVLAAIEARNPGLTLNIRRGPTAALANAIVAESKAGIKRADLFWAVDTGAIGLMSEEGLARSLPKDLTSQLKSEFQYENWSPVTGRIRTLPYNTGKLKLDVIPADVMTLPESGLSMGWAPAYASFQSFVTAMRILEGEEVTSDWLKRMNKVAKPFAGELSVVMSVERGDIDIGFANHYYTLRLKAGKPDAAVNLAFTKSDAGCLVNASGIVALSEGDLPVNFIRYLLTSEVQSYLAREAYEIPLVHGVEQPPGIPRLDSISPPELDLTRLADLKPTLSLMRNAGVL